MFRVRVAHTALGGRPHNMSALGPHVLVIFRLMHKYAVNASVMLFQYLILTVATVCAKYSAFFTAHTGLSSWTIYGRL